MYNSRAKFQNEAREYSRAMSGSSTRSSVLSATEREDAERLKARFERLKAETGMTQAAFAKQFEVPGGPSMVSQHISGHRPISLDAAKAYMRGFNCQLHEISQDLAKQVPRIGMEGLPSELTDRLKKSDPATRRLIEIALLEDDDEAAQALTPSLVSLVRAVKEQIRAMGDESKT